MHRRQRPASPNLSRQSLSKCSSRGGRLPDPQETPPLSSGGETNARKVVQRRSESRLKSAGFHQPSFRKEDASQLRSSSAPKVSKIRLPLCRSAGLLRPYCAARTHLQIQRQKRSSSFLYKKHSFVFSSLCISHVSKAKSHIIQTCRKTPPGRFRMHNITLLEENTDFHTDYLWVKMYIFIRNILRGKLKQGLRQSVENVGSKQTEERSQTSGGFTTSVYFYVV